MKIKNYLANLLALKTTVPVAEVPQERIHEEGIEPDCGSAIERG